MNIKESEFFAYLCHFEETVFSDFYLFLPSDVWRYFLIHQSFSSFSFKGPNEFKRGGKIALKHKKVYDKSKTSFSFRVGMNPSKDPKKTIDFHTYYSGVTVCTTLL